MLEQETELITQIVIESTLGQRDAVKLSEVLTADLPRGIKAYMTAEVVKLLEQDFRQSERLTQVAKGLGGTEAAERSVLRTLAAEYALTREEFLSMVKNAVQFLEKYLCRPQQTLQMLLFEKAEKATLDEVMRAFEYTVDYAYFGELVMRHARTKGWREISAAQFKDLLARIDQAVVKHHTPRELALLAKPIYDFLLFGDASMTRPIPLEAVLSFYEDKGLQAVRDYIERICAVRGRKHISMKDLIEILEDLYLVETEVNEEIAESEQEILQPAPATVSVEEQPSPPEESVQTPEPIVQENAAGVEPVPAPQAERTEEPTPQEKVEGPDRLVTEQQADDVTKPLTPDLEQDVPPSEPHPAPLVEGDVLVQYARERKAQQHNLLLRFHKRTQPSQEPATAQPPHAAQDIHQAFSADQRARFIKRIFKGDENYFFIFLSSMKDVQNWRDAQPYLRDLFEMNNLHHLSPDVIEFTDAMHAYFNPELKKQNEVR